MTAMLLKQLHAPPALTERRYRTFAEISYTVGDLSANQPSDVLKGSQTHPTVVADSSGQVSRTNVSGTAKAAQRAITPAGQPPPTLPTVTLAGNDEPLITIPTVDVSAARLVCSEAGPNSGIFAIRRSGSVTSDLTVKYSLDGTAVNGTDYEPLSGSVTIRAGAESAAVVVQPIDDCSTESAELVTLTLTADASYHVNGVLDTATLIILDDDLPGLDFVKTVAPVLMDSPATNLLKGQTNGRHRLVWNTEAGRRYQLQHRSHLNATNWTKLVDFIPTTNSTEISCEITNSDRQRLYRLVLVH